MNSVDISSEAVERTHEDEHRAFIEALRFGSRVLVEKPNALACADVETFGANVLHTALCSQAKLIKELEGERDAFRAVLEGAEYGGIDAIGRADPDIARLLGRQIMLLTKIKLSEARNDALREAWQPIKTAPKDGTIFVARNADHPRWGSRPMMRKVIWRYSDEISDFICDDCGAWLWIGDHQPDYDEGHTTGRVASIPFSIADDRFNSRVRYEWQPLPGRVYDEQTPPSAAQAVRT